MPVSGQQVALDKVALLTFQKPVSSIICVQLQVKLIFCQCDVPREAAGTWARGTLGPQGFKGLEDSGFQMPSYGLAKCLMSDLFSNVQPNLHFYALLWEAVAILDFNLF